MHKAAPAHYRRGALLLQLRTDLLYRLKMRAHGPRLVSVYASACPTRELLGTIANKWCVLVLALLDQRSRRFGELKREIDGISLRMLAKTLQDLERDGIVVRRVLHTHPPSVTYDLTELGKKLIPTLAQLRDWAEDYIIDIERARERYDTKRSATEQNYTDLRG